MTRKNSVYAGRSKLTAKQRQFLEEIAAGRDPLKTNSSHHQNEVTMQGLIYAGRVIWDGTYQLTAKGRMALTKPPAHKCDRPQRNNCDR